MTATDNLEERMRSMESSAIRATTEFAATDDGLVAPRQTAEKTLAGMRERYEGVGADIGALSATIRQGETAIRSEVTMSQAAAEMLFSGSDAWERPNLDEMSRSVRLRNVAAHTSSKQNLSETLIPEFLESLSERFRSVSLPAWMRAVIRLDQDDKSDAALDEMFDQIDALLSSAEFGKLDHAIAAMPLEGPSLTLMMGLLSITRPAREHLPSRLRYFERVYRLCKAMRRDAESLLGGLR